MTATSVRVVYIFSLFSPPHYVFVRFLQLSHQTSYFFRFSLFAFVRFVGCLSKKIEVTHTELILLCVHVRAHGTVVRIKDMQQASEHI